MVQQSSGFQRNHQLHTVPSAAVPWASAVLLGEPHPLNSAAQLHFGPVVQMSSSSQANAHESASLCRNSDGGFSPWNSHYYSLVRGGALVDVVALEGCYSQLC